MTANWEIVSWPRMGQIMLSIAGFVLSFWRVISWWSSSPGTCPRKFRITRTAGILPSIGSIIWAKRRLVPVCLQVYNCPLYGSGCCPTFTRTCCPPLVSLSPSSASLRSPRLFSVLTTLSTLLFVFEVSVWRTPMEQSIQNKLWKWK